MDSYLIGLQEDNSQFDQTMIFNGKNWFYPNRNGHSEYRLPKCDEKNLLPSIFHFLDAVFNSKTDWLFRLNVYNDKNNNKLLFKEMSDNDDLFESIHVAARTVKIDKNKIQNFIRNGFKLTFVFQLRKHSKQQPYVEESIGNFQISLAVRRLLLFCYSNICC